MKLILDKIEIKLQDRILHADLCVTSGFTGISAPSGTGKTTLLECIAGMRSPSQGRIVLNGRPLVDMEQALFIRPSERKIGYVPQDLLLFPHLNVERNIRFGMREPSTDNSITVDHVCEMLEIIPLLNRKPDRLSGGEKQRVNLARAILSSPTLLLLDEPLSSIDASLKEKMIQLLQRVRDEFKIPSLYVSHNQEEIEKLCDSVLIIENNRLTTLTTES